LTAIDRLTPAWRLLRLSTHLGTGAILGTGVAACMALKVPHPWLSDLVGWWHRSLCRCLSLEVRAIGRPEPAGLLVGNHISWLDIPVLGGLAPARFVSKAEVRTWPLVGWLAGLSGTIFLQRGDHQASAIARSIGARVQRGELVAIFPEGTTHDGRALGRFHARLFAAVEQDEARILPVAIRYGRNAEPDPIAPFIGDDTLLAHLARILKHPGLSVTVTFLEPISAAGLSRRQLAEACRAAIAEAMWQRPAAQGSAAPEAARLGPQAEIDTAARHPRVGDGA
jgi:1-acyl-sn-glycerol-3-phosphate acyltransferase